MCKTSTAIKRPQNLLAPSLLDLSLNFSFDDFKEATAAAAASAPPAPAAPTVALSASSLSLAPSAVPPITFSPMERVSPDSIAAAAASPDSMSEEDKNAIVQPACINCRRSKVRCEGGIPCRRCIRLTLDSTCYRCEPKKRGRKRKANQDAATVGSDDTPSQASKRSRIASSGGATRVKSENGSAVARGNAMDMAAHALPPRSAEQLEQDAVERFAMLTNQFRTWRDNVSSTATPSTSSSSSSTTPSTATTPAAPATDKAALTRFLWFCSDLSHLMNEYSLRLADVADKHKLVSFWLCSNLADDVNRVVTNLGPAAVPFPTLPPAVGLENGVEKQVYKKLPFGMLMMPMQPRPFSPSECKPWVNPKLMALLGYSKDELRGILSQRALFSRLLLNHTAVTAAFWEAVALNKTHFTTRANWAHKTGHAVETVVTTWIKYAKGVPAWQYMFVQQDPSTAPVASSATPQSVSTPATSECAGSMKHMTVDPVMCPAPATTAPAMMKHNGTAAAATAMTTGPVFSSVFDDVVLLSPAMEEHESNTSWDDSVDQWMSNTSLDDCVV